MDRRVRTMPQVAASPASAQSNRCPRWARLFLLLMAAAGLAAGSIAGSKHDLSTSSTADSTQVCMYCHTPHHANNTLTGINAPLWNRVVDTTKTFIVYSSPSMASTPGNPNTTISVLCLGCHDGTISSGTVSGYSFSDKHEVINGAGFNTRNEYPNCGRCHQNIGGVESWWVGTDLSNMHPIAVSYPQNRKFWAPPDTNAGWADVKLYKGKVECPTCHAVHDPDIVPFLRRSNKGSGLCLTCHIN